MFETKEFYIAGVQFQQPGLKSCITELAVGDILSLKADPDNKFDPNAVQIVAFTDDLDFAPEDAVMLGHVKKQFAPEVCAALDCGVELRCTIIELNPSAKPWEMCKIRIEEWNSDYEDGQPSELTENVDFANDDPLERDDED